MAITRVSGDSKAKSESSGLVGVRVRRGVHRRHGYVVDGGSSAPGRSARARVVSAGGGGGSGHSGLSCAWTVGSGANGEVAHEDHLTMPTWLIEGERGQRGCR